MFTCKASIFGVGSLSLTLSLSLSRSLSLSPPYTHIHTQTHTYTIHTPTHSHKTRPHAHACTQLYVLEALGQKYVEPQAFKLDAVFADSAAAVPLIFVLSFGSDPMADLLKFADERHKQVGVQLDVQCSELKLEVHNEIEIMPPLGWVSFGSELLAGALKLVEERYREGR